LYNTLIKKSFIKPDYKNLTANANTLNINPESNLNNDITSSDKKKKQLKQISRHEETILNYAKIYTDEIKNTLNEINNLNSKKVFYSQEENFESFSIPDKFKPLTNQNYIATRNKTNPKGGANTITKFGGVRNKSNTGGFDFQIIGGDDGAYEKIVI
jgi:hypothetical protein